MDALLTRIEVADAAMAKLAPAVDFINMNDELQIAANRNSSASWNQPAAASGAIIVVSESFMTGDTSAEGGAYCHGAKEKKIAPGLIIM